MLRTGRPARIARSLALVLTMAATYALAQDAAPRAAAPEAAVPGDAAAGEATLVVPDELVTASADAFTFAAFGSEVSYLAGLGWTTGWDVPAPVRDDRGRVRIAAETAAALGLPHFGAFRTGLDGATTRLVVDLPEATAAALEGVRREARIGPDLPLELALPGVLVPDATLLSQDELRVDALPADSGEPARIRISGPAASARSFPLADPTRLVVDLTPAGPGDGAATRAPPSAPPSDDRPPAVDVPPEARSVAPGVRYLRLTSAGVNGSSTVHVVELEPTAVELRVVGRSGEGRTVAAWADGAVAAINAGYFDPQTFAAIGLRRIGGTLTSLPSRGRAAVGFGPTGTVVARAGAHVSVRVDGMVAVDATLDGDAPLSWSRVEGARLGSPRRGVLVLDATGRVLRNVVGPMRVPAGGAALAYDPEIRPLALVEPGQRVDVSARLTPIGLERAAWAVEAGPMLIQDGRPAFAPELEGFSRGQRILDEPTQQAALGVRRDGTVLFVVAERMIAEDLVPLFERLDAEQALRLDSGSSATLVADGRTVNRLLSRQVESAIVAVPALGADNPR